MLTLINGLQSQPWSRYRAAILTESPPTATAGAPGWLGWTPEAARLTYLTDVVIASNSKRQPKPLPTPFDVKKVRRAANLSEFAGLFESFMTR